MTMPVYAESTIEYLIVSIPDLCNLTYLEICVEPLDQDKHPPTIVNIVNGKIATESDNIDNVMVEWLFLAVPWGCLRFVIVVFPYHTHLLFWNPTCGVMRVEFMTLNKSM